MGSRKCSRALLRGTNRLIGKTRGQPSSPEHPYNNYYALPFSSVLFEIFCRYEFLWWPAFYETVREGVIDGSPTRFLWRYRRGYLKHSCAVYVTGARIFHDPLEVNGRRDAPFGSLCVPRRLARRLAREPLTVSRLLQKLCSEMLIGRMLSRTCCRFDAYRLCSTVRCVLAPRHRMSAYPPSEDMPQIMPALNTNTHLHRTPSCR